ncbi:hypothetical protein JAAARDRAFT_39759 [Jaapia argillacea MUCL 33604]|uniref:G domain-containing protein n=1 Tax=Jaapia argillacea MUCL 33604 TaxID=933084 RepID=A0A067PRT8_9AGAM|nr:hypothetical protein JAAARDRAFT_39759 [Jaapia argillacea MUCL 33604]
MSRYMPNPPPYQFEGSDGEPEAKIAIMGATGTGKSSFIKSITNDEEIVVGHSLQSQTAKIHRSRYFVPNSSACITFIDTPGFDDSRGAAGGMTDADVLRKIATFLKAEYDQNQKLAGIIYMHRIIDPRMGNSSQRNLRMFKKLCGAESMKNVVIITTMWDKLESPQEGEQRELELKTKEGFFKTLIDQGAQLVRLGRGVAGPKFPPADQIVSDIITHSQPEFTRIQTEMAKGAELEDTSAGAELDGEIRKLKQQHEFEMKQLREEMMEAMRDRDMRAVRELEEERRRNEMVVQRLDEELRQLQDGLNYSRAEMQRMMMQEQQERENQRAAWERRSSHRRGIGGLVGGILTAGALTVLLAPL